MVSQKHNNSSSSPSQIPSSSLSQIPSSSLSQIPSPSPYKGLFSPIPFIALRNTPASFSESNLVAAITVG